MPSVSLRVLLGLSVYVAVVLTDTAGLIHAPGLRRRLASPVPEPSKFNEHGCNVALGQTWCPSKKKCELVDDYDCPGMDAFQAEANLAKWQPGDEKLKNAQDAAAQAEKHEADMVIKVRQAMLAKDAAKSAQPARLESEQRLAEMVAEKQIETVARIRGGKDARKVAQYAEDELSQVALAAAKYEEAKYKTGKSKEERQNAQIAAASERWKGKKAATQAADQATSLASIAKWTKQMKEKKDAADQAEQKEMAIESKLLLLQQKRKQTDPVAKQWKAILAELHLSKQQLKQSQIAALARSTEADICGKIVAAWQKNEQAADDPYAVNLRKHKASWEHFEDPMILENSEKVGAANRAIDYQREHLRLQREAQKQLEHTQQIMSFLKKQQQLILTMETRMTTKVNSEKAQPSEASNIKWSFGAAILTCGLLYVVLKIATTAGRTSDTLSPKGNYDRVKGGNSEQELEEEKKAYGS